MYLDTHMHTHTHTHTHTHKHTRNISILVADHPFSRLLSPSPLLRAEPADYFKFGNGPWWLPQTVYKYAAISKTFMIHINNIKPDLKLSTAARLDVCVCVRVRVCACACACLLWQWLLFVSVFTTPSPLFSFPFSLSSLPLPPPPFPFALPPPNR